MYHHVRLCNIQAATLQPLYRSVCVAWHSQLKELGIF